MSAQGLLQDLEKAHSRILNDFEPDRAIAIFDSVDRSSPYHFVPRELRSLWSQIQDDYGKQGFEAFQKVTLLRLIASFEPRARGRQYTEEIRERFRLSYDRIVTTINHPNGDKYKEESDILLKDLALCRQHMFPAGAQVVEPDSCFDRSLATRAGIRQAFRMFRLLIQSGGNDHWYQIHTHLEELEEFNQEGWDSCYLRLAGMLKRNPKVRGMWGGSWFYDPQLESISPRLTYLRKIPQSNGAFLFYSGVDVEGGALSKSNTRKRAYESGKYVPKSYALIWPREALLRWAANN